MKRFVQLLLLWCAPMMCEEFGQNYFNALTPQEGDEISYIVSTLGNTSPVGLLFKKRSLEKAGDRIGHVHPLCFFQFILDRPGLKASFAKIDGLAWRSFVDGMAESLAKADARNHLSQKIIEDFAHNSHLDISTIQQLLSNKEWKPFISYIKSESL